MYKKSVSLFELHVIYGNRERQSVQQISDALDVNIL